MKEQTKASLNVHNDLCFFIFPFLFICIVEQQLNFLQFTFHFKEHFFFPFNFSSSNSNTQLLRINSLKYSYRKLNIYTNICRMEFLLSHSISLNCKRMKNVIMFCCCCSCLNIRRHFYAK